jgi:hypothetical protein
MSYYGGHMSLMALFTISCGLLLCVGLVALKAARYFTMDIMA